MKKIISLLALSVLLGSCGNRLSIVKRHYTKGFYVENNKKTEHLSVVKAEAKKQGPGKTQPTIVGFLKDERTPDDLVLASTKTNTKMQDLKGSSFQHQLKKHHATPMLSMYRVNLPSEGKKVLFPEFVKKARPSTKGGADTDLIILIILCLFPFINLIAMYLKDGKKVTMNFIVDLILDCLFFLPGIIFALLVVLDVFSLA